MGVEQRSLHHQHSLEQNISFPHTRQLHRGPSELRKLARQPQAGKKGELVLYPPRVAGDILQVGTQQENEPSGGEAATAGFVFQGPLPLSSSAVLAEQGQRQSDATAHQPERDTVSERRTAPQLRELAEGVPQELPKASEVFASETDEERRRQLRNEARYRWNKKHPEKHRDEVARWQQSEKGKKYISEYMRDWRKKKKDQEEDEGS